MIVCLLLMPLPGRTEPRCEASGPERRVGRFRAASGQLAPTASDWPLLDLAAREAMAVTPEGTIYGRPTLRSNRNCLKYRNEHWP